MSLYFGQHNLAKVLQTYNSRSAIDDYHQEISNSYSAVETKGGTIPQSKTVYNLSSSIESIDTGYAESPSYSVDSNGKASKSYVYDADFSNIKCIKDYGLYYAFSNCSKLSSVSFPSLASVGSNGLYRVFSNCSKLSSVSFPSLASVGSLGLFYAFYSCSKLKEIHFRADAESVISAQSGYSSKFGASNATIYFDL